MINEDDWLKSERSVVRMCAKVSADDEDVMSYVMCLILL